MRCVTKSKLAVTVTIRSVRIYYFPRTEPRELRLNRTHWGFADWFVRRLKPIRERLRGPEAKGVDIVNFMLHEVPEHAWRPNEWAQRMNSFNFSFVCDLRPLEKEPPIDNIEKLMKFASVVARHAPWPQVRVVGEALAIPLTDYDRATLLPFLRWPRENLVY